MDIRVFSPTELHAVLRALRNVAQNDQGFSDGERNLVEGIAHIHQVEITADALEPISFTELASTLVDPQRRKRAVQLAVVMSLVEGTPSRRAQHCVSELAHTLGIHERSVSVLYKVSHGHAMLARFDMLRRFSGVLRNMNGFPGVWKMAPIMLGLAGDVRLAARYRDLEQCARGTLGRTLFDHFQENGFKLPGEPGGIPMVFHDLGHVLSGYGTDPQSEIQQAAFQAGFARQDGFTFLLFGILQFHLGLRITPVAQGYHGLFDVARVVEALARGAACRVDLSDGYDVFLHKDRALEEVREELGIVPARALAA